MNELIKFYKIVSSEKKTSNIRLLIHHGPVTDWTIEIKVGIEGEVIFNGQDCDYEILAAKAQVSFKEWLLDHEGGY